MRLQNLRYAFRRLRKSPGFSTSVVAILALGIGANTAIFSVVYGVLLKPLGFPEPNRLVTIHESVAGGGASFPDLPVNANHLMYWRQHSRSFSGIAAMLPESMPLGGTHPEEINVGQETANLFAVLGVQPRMGRSFRSDEEQPGHGDVVILTDGLWRRFGADPRILGRSIMMDGKPYVVVGVLPPEFSLPQTGKTRPLEAFVPFTWTPEVLQEPEGDHNYFAIARLKGGVTAARANGELNSLQRAIGLQTPDKVQYGATVTLLQDFITGASRQSLLLLLAGVAAVFLIACINIANLLLNRASTSEHETAVRLALGSTRVQLFSGALAEPAILCSAGWILGAVFAAVATPALLRTMPLALPRLAEVHVDVAAVAFAGGMSLFAALLCSILPVWRYMHGEAESALRANARTVSESRSGKRLRGGLVVAEVAASVALLAVAGLLLTSIIKLNHVTRGFDAAHVVSASVVLPDKQYGEKSTRNGFYERTLTRLRELPGVQAAGAISVLPLDGDNWGDLISRAGDTTPLWQRPAGHFRWITPGYFEALRIPLLAGRLLADADKGKPVALISRSAAARVWPRQSAVGQRFQRGDPDEAPFEVIGVVDDVRSLDLSQAPPLMVYLPYWYRSREVGSFVVRTGQDAAGAASMIRNAIWSIDPQVPVPQVRTMGDVVSGSIATRRFETNLLLSFAMTAMLLAAIGIYGVVAYAAVQRTREIGVRMAVGASTSDIYRLIIGHGIAPVLAGVAVGLALAIFGGRLVAAMLFDVSTYDPVVTVSSAAILTAVGICACLIPAWRATKTDPTYALRFE
jgi:predicted permease